MDLISNADAQEAPSLADLERDAADLRDNLSEAQAAPASTSTWWSVTDAMTISASVLVFGLVIIAIAAWLLRHERESQVILRALATILIVTFAVFLIVAGYSDRQIAPAMGLLGTLAGYLLGKDTKEAVPPKARAAAD
jgi:NhaP-type Na+/H+ or K+/H+ antiporter